MRQILELISPAVYRELRRAVEIGRWADGQTLSREQRASCLQAMLLYEAQNLPAEQRSGYIAPRDKPSPCDPAPAPPGLIARSGEDQGE